MKTNVQAFPLAATSEGHEMNSYISLMLDAEAVKERLRNYCGKIIVTNQATGTFIGCQSASPTTNGTD